MKFGSGIEFKVYCFCHGKFVDFKKMSFILLSLIYVFNICGGNYC